MLKEKAISNRMKMCSSTRAWRDERETRKNAPTRRAIWARAYAKIKYERARRIEQYKALLRWPAHTAEFTGIDGVADKMILVTAQWPQLFKAHKAL